MWTTENVLLFNGEHLVRLSVEMNYPDWCKFEKSNAFLYLTQYLEELQKQYTPTLQQETED